MTSVLPLLAQQFVAPSSRLPLLPSALPPAEPPQDIFSFTDGQLAARLAFVKEIGWGNWGSTWQCKRKEEDGCEVAVKLVHRNKTPTTAARVRALWTEFKVIRHLSAHPNIIHFEDFIITPSYALITMQLLPTTMPVGIDEERARQYFKGLLSGCAFLHGNGVAHNDIKPANIMLTTEDNPVLLDFGFAQRYELDSPGAFQSSLCWGTPEYLSPERASGKLHDERLADVWSLGVTVFEIIIGRTPFELEGPVEEYQSKAELDAYFARTETGKWEGTWSLSRPAEVLLKQMIHPNPSLRISALDALVSPYFDEQEHLNSLICFPLTYTYSPSRYSPKSAKAPTAPPLSPLGPTVELQPEPSLIIDARPLWEENAVPAVVKAQRSPAKRRPVMVLQDANTSLSTKSRSTPRTRTASIRGSPRKDASCASPRKPSPRKRRDIPRAARKNDENVVPVNVKVGTASGKCVFSTAQSTRVPLGGVPVKETVVKSELVATKALETRPVQTAATPKLPSTKNATSPVVSRADGIKPALPSPNARTPSPTSRIGRAMSVLSVGERKSGESGRGSPRAVKASLPIHAVAAATQAVGLENRLDRVHLWVANLERAVQEAQASFATGMQPPLPPIPVTLTPTPTPTKPPPRERATTVCRTTLRGTSHLGTPPQGKQVAFPSASEDDTVKLEPAGLLKTTQATQATQASTECLVAPKDIVDDAARPSVAVETDEASPIVPEKPNTTSDLVKPISADPLAPHLPRRGHRRIPTPYRSIPQITLSSTFVDPADEHVDETPPTPPLDKIVARASYLKSALGDRTIVLHDPTDTPIEQFYERHLLASGITKNGNGFESLGRSARREHRKLVSQDAKRRRSLPLLRLPLAPEKVASAPAVPPKTPDARSDAPAPEEKTKSPSRLGTLVRSLIRRKKL